MKLIRTCMDVSKTRPTRNEYELKCLLLDKVLEEAYEVVEAPTEDKLAEEVGDLYEALDALVTHFDIEMEVVQARVIKYSQRGGFIDAEGNGVVYDSEV